MKGAKGGGIRASEINMGVRIEIGGKSGIPKDGGREREMLRLGKHTETVRL